MNSTTGRLLIAAPVRLGAVMTQDLVAELIVDDVGNFVVLNLGADVVLNCVEVDKVDVKTLPQVAYSAKHSEPTITSNSGDLNPSKAVYKIRRACLGY
jgi:hypothetical protein